ncbi:glycerol dehydrogenase [Oceanidesulfovibrio marinus]|uniref:Glycerol dehydrogenase n=1 Tax=Oceanidesulfovibrio marinus TaxID=370038 RepID=A0A6P1ZBV2_9BACT|nr:glycerol dehydrogenase [Oceanidesulfovibrio marinus]QJT09766.1 glycerol dehydrogenase [Oceanidesulfovibrio marinus]TVM31578.1 glycerol dehydrogenase [Oceanidesulfovibrio marinus]
MKAMGFPLVYKLGDGLLDNIGEYVRPFGKKPLVVADAFVRSLYEEALVQALKREDITPLFVDFGGECSPAAIESASQKARDEGCDCVLGFGGGKAIDTAKAVKIETGIHVIIVPTIASNDSATGRLAITYNDDGTFIGPRFLENNPDAVLVDTGIVARAPVRFFIAGIADALVTKFEADQCVASGCDNFFGARPTEAAICLADACYTIVRKYAPEAVRHVREQRVSEAVEKVVEANTLLSGLGFEGCGVAAAHAIGMALADLPGAKGVLHGEEVALGLIAQFMLEKRDDAFMKDMLDFYTAVGLPASLKDLGIPEPDAEQLRKTATFVLRPKSRIHNMSIPVTIESVEEAITQANKFVAAYRAGSSDS